MHRKMSFTDLPRVDDKTVELIRQKSNYSSDKYFRHRNCIALPPLDRRHLEETRLRTFSFVPFGELFSEKKRKTYLDIVAHTHAHSLHSIDRFVGYRMKEAQNAESSKRTLTYSKEFIIQIKTTHSKWLRAWGAVGVAKICLYIRWYI